MKICSWNVAGLRACERKGLYDWYQSFLPDVLCMQETKALPEQLSEDMNYPKFHNALYAPAQRKGYSGVGTWTHKDLQVDHIIGLNKAEYDDEGRTIITEFESFFLFNCYFPNGSRDHSRVPYKLSFSKEVAKQAIELKENTGKEIIITGDFNTAHHAIDLANPKTNTKSTGFLPIEREWMDEFQNQGFVDCFRLFNPNENGHYTWWTYRGDCRERNIGWRIDYFWCTEGMVKQIKNCYHLPDITGSDHCPIVLEIQ